MKTFWKYAKRVAIVALVVVGMLCALWLWWPGNKSEDKAEASLATEKLDLNEIYREKFVKDFVDEFTKNYPHVDQANSPIVSTFTYEVQRGDDNEQYLVGGHIHANGDTTLWWDSNPRPKR